MRIARLRVLLCLLVAASAALVAQAPVVPLPQRGAVTVYAASPNDLRQWDRAIDGMVRGRELLVLSSRPDPDIEGRQHESLAQYYQGVPVFGGTLTRQTAQGLTVSIIGTVYEGISIDTTPALSPAQVVLALADVSGGRLVGDVPTLLIFPTFDGQYRLAYRATMSDAKTYIVDAASGSVLWTIEEIKTQTQAQSQVGVGTGVLGDTKKISTTRAGTGFRAQDQLRPAPIRTFDTHGSEVAMNRLTQPPGATVDSDFAVDTDNTWADPPVVDAHVHSGWTEDYFFRQLGWTGIDNRRGVITSVVHTGLVDNAQYWRPPFGADSRGMLVFGRTRGGVPVTALDVVAHEMMHGVTNASLTQRLGSGLLDTLSVDRVGPTAMTFGGSSYPCDTTVVVFNDGTQLPILCSGGRYVLWSNHPGAINEAFSDVFGISAEFFYQPVGAGALRADYKMGEDVAGFGPLRAADVPSSLVAAASSQGPMAYPDHASRTFSFIAAISQGTRTNPIAITPLPWLLQGDQLVTMPSSDSAGVHLNSTVLSHAFYLAIEGGRNATSGLTVQGVGPANRIQIEKSFFRAMTVNMPSVPTMQMAAQATVQAAVDLYGANSAPAVAIRQAMQAVGLMN